MSKGSNMKHKIANAIARITGGSVPVLVNGEDYESIVWQSDENKPTWSEIQSEIERFDLLLSKSSYQQKRAAEYPPITDYLDGVVKGDQAQIDAYIAACQAVKAKYPKP